MNPIKYCKNLFSPKVFKFLNADYSLRLEPSLQQELELFRKERNFQAKEWIEEKAGMLNDYMSSCGLKAIACNLSGGVDSSVTFALVNYAKEKPDSSIERLVGISQPIHSTAKITDRSYLLEPYGEIITVDQTGVYDELCPLVEGAIEVEGDVFQQGQLKSYMRTPVLYYVAQLLSLQGYPCVTMGTGNFDEDGYLYYFCKAGDGIADLQIINELHKSEVFKVGYELGLPESILGAPPSADLWEGQTDEDELGFPYDYVELYTEYLELGEPEKFEMFDRLTPDGMFQFKNWEVLINQVHKANSHKETYPLNLNIERFDLKNNCRSSTTCKKEEEEESCVSDSSCGQQEENIMKQLCPICECRVEPSHIYEDYVCMRCYRRLEDGNGRQLFFMVVDDPETGRTKIQGFYDEKGSDECGLEDTCFVDGVECVVEIGVFGGKVVHPK